MLKYYGGDHLVQASDSRRLFDKSKIFGIECFNSQWCVNYSVRVQSSVKLKILSTSCFSQYTIFILFQTVSGVVTVWLLIFLILYITHFSYRVPFFTLLVAQFSVFYNEFCFIVLMFLGIIIQVLWCSFAFSVTYLLLLFFFSFIFL